MVLHLIAGRMKVAETFKLPLLGLWGVLTVGEVAGTSFMPLLTDCLYASGHRSRISASRGMDLMPLIANGNAHSAYSADR